MVKKFDGILFVTDLDGTLLKNDKSISKENLEAIDYFRSQGGKFTFITGRVPSAARHIYEILKTDIPAGCINGGGVFDYEKNKMLRAETLDRSVMELIEFAEKKFESIGIEVVLWNKAYFSRKNAFIEKHRIDEKFEDLILNYRSVKEDISKILFADEDKVLKNLEKVILTHPLAKNFSFLRTDEHYFEILPKGTDKSNAMEEIAKLCNAKITVAAGDNDNDASMVKKADIGFAVSNATEKTKSCADFITVSNEENAIAKVIEKLEKMNL